MLHTVKDFMVNYADKKEGSNPDTKKKKLVEKKSVKGFCST